MRPRTTDDLAVVVDVPTVDPRVGAGAPTYTYAWSKNTVLVPDQTTSSIQASATARGDVWSVVVTPVTDEGLAGPAATAMVTIANTPPTLRTVGLSSYGPIAGGTLEIIPGPSADDDGDTISYQFEWLAEGASVGGANTAFFSSFTAGQHIIGRSRATDGADASEWVQVGPVTVLADVTRWRALLPQREIGGEGFVEYDEPNDRLVVYSPATQLFASTQTWEYPMHGDGRFRQLFPQGAAPKRGFAAHCIDSRNHRVVVYGGSDRSGGSSDGHPTNSVYALDLTRGAEQWVELHPGGTPPPVGFGGTIANDRLNHRLLALSGYDTSGQPAAGVFSLDVESPGSEQWSSLGTLAEGLIRPVVIRDEHRARFLILGLGAAGPAAYEIRDSTGTVESVSADIAALAIGPLAMVEPDGQHAVLAFGQLADGSLAHAMYRLDLVTLALSEDSWTGSAPNAAATTGTAAQVDRSRFIVWPGATTLDRGELTFYTADIESRQWELVHDDRSLGPPAAESAVVMSFGTMSGGLMSTGTVDAGIWTFSSSMWLLRPSPAGFAPRYDWGRYDSTSPPALIWGGLGASGTLADTHAREMFDQHDLGELLPSRSIHGSAVVASCGVGTVLVGGMDASEHPVNAVEELVCAGTCDWVDFHAFPTPIAWGVGMSFMGGGAVFGGWDGASAIGDLRTTDCTAGSTWPVAASGLGPSARLGHTVTSLTMAGTDWIVAGGMATNTVFLAAFDTWQLHRSGSNWSWVELTPAGERPAARAFHALWADGPNRLLLFGGRSDADRLSDMWELRIRP